MFLKKNNVPGLLMTSVILTGVSFTASAEQLPATPHQAEAIDAVETNTAPRPPTEQRMPAVEHQREALRSDGETAQEDDWSRRLDKLQTYTAEQRDEAIEEARAALTTVDARIDRLQTSLATSGDELTAATRERMNSSIDALQAQRQDLAEWMGGLMHSSAQAWQHVQTGFVGAYRAFAEQLDKAEKEF